MQQSAQYQSATPELARQAVLVSAEAFHEGAERDLERLKKHGSDQYRVVTVGDEVAATLHFLDDAQQFGGQWVRSWALDGVATAPHHRYQGVGRMLMLGMLREARDAGVPLSVLYASTPNFYRAVGYEPAGRAYRWEYDADLFPKDRTDAQPRRYTEKDRESLKAIYAQAHAGGNGVLARTDELFWDWRLNPMDKSDRTNTFLFDFEGSAEAYAMVAHEARRHRHGGVDVVDCAATTLRGWRALATFFHGYNSVNEKVRWNGSHANPLRLLIPDNPATHYIDEWLLRITDPAAALSQRGYPKCHCELHLDITDEMMPENAGRIALSLRDGVPTVQPGGSGRIVLDIRALTAIYASHAAPFEMQAVGLLDGPADDLTTMQQAFAGPRPYMVDQF